MAPSTAAHPEKPLPAAPEAMVRQGRPATKAFALMMCRSILFIAVTFHVGLSKKCGVPILVVVAMWVLTQVGVFLLAAAIVGAPKGWSFAEVSDERTW